MLFGTDKIATIPPVIVQLSRFKLKRRAVVTDEPSRCQLTISQSCGMSGDAKLRLIRRCGQQLFMVKECRNGVVKLQTAHYSPCSFTPFLFFCFSRKSFAAISVTGQPENGNLVDLCPDLNMIKCAWDSLLLMRHFTFSSMYASTRHSFPRVGHRSAIAVQHLFTEYWHRLYHVTRRTVYNFSLHGSSAR